MTIDFSKLAEPFPAEDIEWRVQSSGKKGDKPWARVLAYVTNRAIQSRLDEVVGPDNWQNVYTTGPGGGVLCGISIRVERAGEEAEWVTKWDGSENTDIEAVKGGLSGAMKRAAVHWGIGRYLYNLPAGWAQVESDKRQALHSDKLKDGSFIHWNPPPLPPWALPIGSESSSATASAVRTAARRPAETVSPADLKKLAAHAKAHDIEPSIVTKLAEERFGRGPRELRQHEFNALWDRVELGDWLPDDIDETMPDSEVA